MVINIINNNLLDDCYYELSKTFGLMILNQLDKMLYLF